MPLSFPDLSLLRWITRPTNTTERNFRNVLIDGIGVGIVTGVASFLPVFLARLGASNLMVGLITSLPALAGALFAVAVGRFIERQRNVVPWYSSMRVWVLWSYVIFGLLPFFVPLDWVPTLVILIWALVTIPSTFVNVAFTVVMGGVAGPARRFTLMSMRWSSLGAVTALTVALTGLVLDKIAFPLNYQIVFIASFVGGLLSYLFSRSIVLPDNPAYETYAKEPKQRWNVLSGTQLWSFILSLRTAPPTFVRFVGSAFLFRCGVAMGIPLFPLYWVREIQASDAWIGIFNTASSGVLMIAYFLWSIIVRRIGVGYVLLISGAGMAVYPLLVAFSEQTALLAFLAGLSGFFAAGNDLVNFDLVLNSCPKEHQATYIGIHQTLQNLALFLLPLVGTFFADLIGLRGALIIAGILRLAGVACYALLHIGESETAPKVVQNQR